MRPELGLISTHPGQKGDPKSEALGCSQGGFSCNTLESGRVWKAYGLLSQRGPKKRDGRLLAPYGERGGQEAGGSWATEVAPQAHLRRQGLRKGGSQTLSEASGHQYHDSQKDQRASWRSLRLSHIPHSQSRGEAHQLPRTIQAGGDPILEASGELRGNAKDSSDQDLVMMCEQALGLAKWPCGR
jgi:hypothetical protein